MTRIWTTVALCLLLATPAVAQQRRIETKTGPVQVQTIARGLERPWSLAFLPDGRMLVTERPGRLRIVSPAGQVSAPLAGLPPIFAEGQGGLLDVALAPDFAQSRMIYFSFAEPEQGGGPLASTAVARGRLGEGRIENVQTIFSQKPKVDGGNHFGSRLAFARDGTLFITTGERFKFDPAQDLMTHLGKVIRINADGSVPRDNPFVGRNDALPEIWSYGHRNVQGAAINPQTGALWTNEMGPRGGDELNITEAGKNYGWPLVSWGSHYNGRAIPKPTTRPDLADAIAYWNPVIAPAGMAFYTATAIPNWTGSVLLGGLVEQGITRLTLDGNRVAGEERIGLGTRIRDVRQGPDGAVYAVTDEDNGVVLKITAGR